MIVASMFFLWFSNGTATWQWPVLLVLRTKHTASVFCVVKGWVCRLLIYSWYLYGGPEDNHKNLYHDNRCPGPESNRKLPKYPTEVLPVPPPYSVTSMSKWKRRQGYRTLDIPNLTTLEAFAHLRYRAALLVLRYQCFRTRRSHLEGSSSLGP